MYFSWHTDFQYTVTLVCSLSGTLEVSIIIVYKLSELNIKKKNKEGGGTNTGYLFTS